MFTKLEVNGQMPLNFFQEGTFLEIDQSGLFFIYNFRWPTVKEINAVSMGASFEIRYMVKSGVLWVFLKCGDLPWAEAPYSPHLSRCPFLDEINDDSSGYGITLIMVDSIFNRIKSIRLVGLGNRFSKALKKDVDELLAAPFDPYEHDTAIFTLQQQYTAAQLARMCSNYYKLKS